MVHQVVFGFLVWIGLMSVNVGGTYIGVVANASWNGVSFYISVRREIVQKKLDDFHGSGSYECGKRPNLFLPKTPLVPDLQTTDHHLVYVDFGFMTVHDFDDYLKRNPERSISVSGLEVAVAIPLLAANCGGPPAYSLAVAILYERSRGDIPKPNFIYPYIPVDAIQLSDSGAVVRNGSDELRVSFIQQRHPCKPASSIVKEELKEYLEEYQVGLAEPDFSFCDRHSIENDFCTNAKRAECAVRRYAPNICQIYRRAEIQSCEASVQIVNITSGFRDFILVGNDPINIFTSAYSYGPPLTTLKSPCQE